MDDPRVDPDVAADERTTLTQFLDWYRLTIEVKVAGLTEEQSRFAPGPSATSPIGLVRHLAEVERGWFRRRFAGEDIEYRWFSDDDPDGDFHVGPDDTLADALAIYREECAHSREITAGSALDDLARVAMRTGAHVSLRWILVHMIEETARHAGHLDILREQLDGAVGD
ncbi:MAG TPA: DinB family protein [Acidimicrobiia bacterium]|nr:DinB family protein [Acidimicrobiia bacterium]